MSHAEAIAFLETAFRNIDLPPLDEADLADIGASLAQHATTARCVAVEEEARVADELTLALADADGAEINPSNYDHDDACHLNDGYVAAFQIAEQAIEALRKLALSPPRPVREDVDGQTYAAWQQKRGRAADLIDWAVNEFDAWMADDDYDTRACLDRIVDRFRQYRAEQALPGSPS